MVFRLFKEMPRVCKTGDGGIQITNFALTDRVTAAGFRFKKKEAGKWTRHYFSL
jgi:hypothetical protein